MFFSFSKQSWAESSRNLIKKSVWDPKCGNRRKHKENIFLKFIFMKNVMFGIQTTFLDGFNMLMSFLTEK